MAVSVSMEDNEVVITRKTKTCGYGMSFDLKEMSILDILKLLIRRIYIAIQSNK